MCVHLCVCVCSCECRYLWSPEKDIRAEVSGSCEPSYVGSENWTQVHALNSWLILSAPPAFICFSTLLICLGFVVSVLGLKPRSRHMLNKSSISELTPPQAPPFLLPWWSHFLEIKILKPSIHQTLLRTKLTRRVLGFRLWLIKSSVRTRWNVFKNKYLHWFFYWKEACFCDLVQSTERIALRYGKIFICRKSICSYVWWCLGALQVPGAQSTDVLQMDFTPEIS